MRKLGLLAVFVAVLFVSVSLVSAEAYQLPIDKKLPRGSDNPVDPVDPGSSDPVFVPILPAEIPEGASNSAPVLGPLPKLILGEMGPITSLAIMSIDDDGDMINLYVAGLPECAQVLPLVSDSGLRIDVINFDSGPIREPFDSAATVAAVDAQGGWTIGTLPITIWAGENYNVSPLQFGPLQSVVVRAGEKMVNIPVSVSCEDPGMPIKLSATGIPVGAICDPPLVNEHGDPLIGDGVVFTNISLPIHEQNVGTYTIQLRGSTEVGYRLDVVGTVRIYVVPPLP